MRRKAVCTERSGQAESCATRATITGAFVVRYLNKSEAVEQMLYALRNHTWKLHLFHSSLCLTETLSVRSQVLFNLFIDLKEERDMAAKDRWVGVPMTRTGTCPVFKFTAPYCTDSIATCQR
jgi:hypothetical protein